MNTEEMEELFEKFGEEYDFQGFEKIENKLSNCSDLHAFILLDKLVPGGGAIAAAEHDEIFLEADIDKLAAAITEEQVRELVACGIRLSEYGGLAKFV